MSEFTNGVLFLAKDQGPVVAGFERAGLEHLVRSLNAKWGVVLLADGWLDNPDSAGALEQISRSAPLLFFWNAEDHGWGYRVFNQGEVTAGLDVSYDLAFNMAMEVFEERYPDADPFDDEGAHPPAFEALVKEIGESEEYAGELREQYEHVHPECLAVFDIGPEAVESLTALLSADYSGTGGIWDQVEEFKRLLDIEEMSWIRYDGEEA